MQLPITHHSLESMASAESFARGEDYYHYNSVENIVFDGQRFSAKVQGTYPYQVEISGSPTDTYTHCSCPYDWGGICKHIVAVGLAILDGKFEDESDEYDDAEVAETETISLKNFTALFDRTEDITKLSFLQQLLSQNTQLKTQFVKYVAAQQQRPVESLLDDRVLQIEKVKEEVSVVLESLTFDEEDLFPPGYYENGGYYDEWSDAEEGGDKIIQKGLASYLKQAKYYFQQGELAQGLSIVLGIYESVFSITSPSSDPLSIVEDYPERIKEVLNEQLTPLFQSLQTTVKAELEIEAAVDLLFSRYQYYEVNPAPSKNGTEGIYYLKDFEAFLLAMIVDPSMARFLLQRMREEDVVDVDTAHVVLRVAETLQDDTLWIKTAQEFLDFDNTLAQPLLEKYHQLDKTEDFLQTAQRAFQQFPEQTARYLAEKLSPELSLDFYKKVYSYLVKQGGQVEYYQSVRPHLSESEKNRLIQAVKTNDVYYVQLLALEEQHEEILRHVQNRTGLDYGFEKLIEPILSVYPARCFVILEKKCWQAIELRGRSVYRMIARWLQLMQQIPGHRDEAEALASQFYHHKPNLPALRDEMRKAGVATSASYR
ncbi:SWIM zinc finger family protein [Tunicatimonas pelagia]|uniref:SWIM zinc finger family protein n=1 Tax=Tunicatimonas pelagia TaxID=931531 RepID=UPI00266584E8|nr:hypothetical protein [Tunicatimonas pelagia]WKN42704.1 hypothetical protein P0M28_27070 [Tunicatimonas pelagia]